MTHGNWKTTAKRALACVRLLPAARSIHYHVRRMLDRAFREQEARREQEFLQFEAGHGAAFRRAATAGAQDAKRLLGFESRVPLEEGIRRIIEMNSIFEKWESTELPYLIDEMT